MRSRGLLAFHPGLKCAFVIEGLEDRRLLSGMGTLMDFPDRVRGDSVEVQTTSVVRLMEGVSGTTTAVSDSPGGPSASDALGITTNQSQAEGKTSGNLYPSESPGAASEMDSTSSSASVLSVGARLGPGPSDLARSQSLSLALTSPAASAGTSGAEDGSSLDQWATADPGEAPSPDAPIAAIVLSSADQTSGVTDSSISGGGPSNATKLVSLASADLPRAISVPSAESAGSATETREEEATSAPGAFEITLAKVGWRGFVPHSSHQVRDLRKRSDAMIANETLIEVEEPVPSPRGSDLLTNFLPFDRASLENAIDRFLVEFENLGAELTGRAPATHLVPALAVVTISALATEVARRKRSAMDRANSFDEGR